MKKIEAVIAPFELDVIQEALRHVGVKGMTVLEVKSANDGNCGKRVYRGAEYTVDFLPKLKIELLVEDGDAAAASGIIEGSTQNGRSNSGTIFVSSVDDIVRIRTGEHGVGAI